MEIHVSRPLKENWPDLEKLLLEVGKIAKDLDRDVRTRLLLVDVKCCSDLDAFCGSAYPRTFTIDRRWGRDDMHYHPPGRITMSLGIEICEQDIATLFGHELRHIAQFKRGAKKYGYLTYLPLSGPQAENDAYEFEENVAERF